MESFYNQTKSIVLKFGENKNYEVAFIVLIPSFPNANNLENYNQVDKDNLERLVDGNISR